MKTLIRYFLLLCILAWIGHFALHGQACTADAFYPILKNANGAAHSTANTIQSNDASLIKSSSPRSVKGPHKVDIEETEIEEEEHGLEHGGHIASILFVHTFKHFLSNIESYAHVKDFSNTSSGLYLVFQAFRI